MSIWYTDLKILLFEFLHFGLKCLFRPQNGGFWGLWTPKCDCSVAFNPNASVKTVSEHTGRRNFEKSVSCQCIHQIAKCQKFLGAPVAQINSQLLLLFSTLLAEAKLYGKHEFAGLSRNKGSQTVIIFSYLPLFVSSFLPPSTKCSIG